MESADIEELLEKLIQGQHLWKNETEVRHNWATLLEQYLNIKFELERDRKDLSYNHIIIEFKDLGLFNGNEESPKFKEAIYDRLDKYISKQSIKEGRLKSEYVGIAIDGKHLAFAEFKEQTLVHGPLLPVSEITVRLVCEILLKGNKRALTEENLISDFGHKSKIGRELMTNLAIKLYGCINNDFITKTSMLFREWESLYGQVATLSENQVEDLNNQLSFNHKFGDNIPALLFVIHTYNSIVIKVLSAEIISSIGLTSYQFFSLHTVNLGDDNLLNVFKSDIERGRLFSNAGINSFSEEAIFSWYVEDVSENGKDVLTSLRNLTSLFSLYNSDNLDHLRTKDILKLFYQDLVPQTLRKSLGEYYTPDWLVSHTLNRLEINHWENVRILDPTCGSGSFIIEAIHRKRLALEALNHEPNSILDNVIRDVWGFDLNPLAVQTARTNYLIAISELLGACKGKQIEIPILLADAVYSPAPDPNEDEKIVKYTIGSNVADLTVEIPAMLVFERNRLDAVLEVMGQAVENNMAWEQASYKLLYSKAITKQEAIDWDYPLSYSYNKVLDLHKRNWNGIWFRIVRNYFRSANAGKFDYIMGNPPWVRWSKLPELYRERVKPVCVKYDIFSSTPHHGGNELDVSGLITYTVADKWLKENGKMGFLITQSHFQAPSSEGFRRFNITEDYKLVPILVEDLKEIKPFPDAANRTALGIFIKIINGVVHYPISYYLWKANGASRAIPVNSTLENVLKRVSISINEANPVGGEGSPWAILPNGRFERIKNNIIGRTDWIQGRKGITVDLNALYFVDVNHYNHKENLIEITTRPQAGKKNIGPSKKYFIEPDFLFPLIKGASDFTACRFTRKHNLYAIVPNKGITKDYYSEAETKLSLDLPKTSNYFNSNKELLLKRSTLVTRQKNAPFYAIYNVGDYTFSPFKVIWAEQSSKFCAAVVEQHNGDFEEEKPFVPDHKIYFIDFYNRDEAYFVCGLLNAQSVQEYIESHSISIQVSNILKHLKIPMFNPKESKHLTLAKKVMETHHEAIEKYPSLLKEVKVLAEKILFP